MAELWERQETETNKHYQAFCMYRDLGYGRSLAKVNEMMSEKPVHRRVLERWSSQDHWVERVEAYDMYIEKENRIKNEQEIEEMKKRHIQQSLLMQRSVIARIQDVNPSELSLSECTRMFEVAVKIERLSRDCDYDSNKVEVNNIISESDRKQLRLDKLSTEELEEYEALLSKINSEDE